jgi:hypothetical protein
MLALVAAITVVTAVGCMSRPVRVGTPPPESQDVIGLRFASACGVLLFDLIPLGINDRVERAYDQAVRSSGASALRNPTVQDNWYWIGVGDMLCTDIEGDAVR